MAFWERRNELLVASPMASRVIRMDADTLKTLGYIPAVFGVRTLAIDAAHDLLLCGSLTTGQVDVIDLQNGNGSTATI